MKIEKDEFHDPCRYLYGITAEIVSEKVEAPNERLAVGTIHHSTCTE